MQKTASNKTLKFYAPLFIILYNLVGNLSNDMYLPSLPLLTHEFQVSAAVVQLTMAAWFLGVSSLQLYFGLLANKIGRRKLIIMSCMIFIVSSAGCALATHIALLIVMRFFQGVGVASLNISAYTTLKSQAYNETESITLINYLAMTGAAAPIIGPIIGSYITFFLAGALILLFCYY